MYALDFLNKVKASLEKLRHPFARVQCTGICANLGDVMYYEYGNERRKWLKSKFLAWSEFSGDEDYPVKFEGQAPGRAYDQCFEMWDENTEYGSARLRLLEFLISEVENDIKEAEHVRTSS